MFGRKDEFVVRCLIFGGGGGGYGYSSFRLQKGHRRSRFREHIRIKGAFESEAKPKPALPDSKIVFRSRSDILHDKDNIDFPGSKIKPRRMRAGGGILTRKRLGRTLGSVRIEMIAAALKPDVPISAKSPTEHAKKRGRGLPKSRRRCRKGAWPTLFLASRKTRMAMRQQGQDGCRQFYGGTARSAAGSIAKHRLRPKCPRRSAHRCASWVGPPRPAPTALPCRNCRFRRRVVDRCRPC